MTITLKDCGIILFSFVFEGQPEQDLWAPRAGQTSKMCNKKSHSQNNSSKDTFLMFFLEYTQHIIFAIIQIHFLKSWPKFGAFEQARFWWNCDFLSPLGNGENQILLHLVYIGPPYKVLVWFFGSGFVNSGLVLVFLLGYMAVKKYLSSLVEI